MLRLKQQGLVQEASAGAWCMTDKLEHFYLEDSLWLVAPVRFFQDRPEVHALQCSKFECKQRLEILQWTSETLSERARAPYVPGSAKVWFVDRKNNYFTSYARCLLMAEELFKAGVCGIYHGQSDSYYNCLLSIADDRKSEVRPYQKAAVYKAMLAGQDSLPTDPETLLCLADEDGVPASSSSELITPAPAVDDSSATGPAVLAPPRPAPVVDGPSPAGPAVLARADDNPRLRRPPPTGEDRAQGARQRSVQDPSVTRNQRHVKSVAFGDHDIRFVPSSPVNQYRAHCSNCRHVDETYLCTKSMRVNQASSEEAVVRRLKAWILAGYDVESRHEHVFLTTVPAEATAGTNEELDARLARLLSNR